MSRRSVILGAAGLATAGLVLVGCGGASKPPATPAALSTAPRTAGPTGSATAAAPDASVPQAPPGVAQQCVAVEGLLTNATSVITSSGSLDTAADLKTRFDAYGQQLTAAAVGGPATLQTGVTHFVAALNTYATDAATGTNPPPNLLSDAATALSAACSPAP